MQQILLFAVLGLGTGALIAGLALSLVLTYRGSGTINFAAGSVAMLGAYVFYGLRSEGFLLIPALRVAGPQGTVVPTPAAAVYTLLVSAAAGVALHYLVLRPLRHQSALAKLVATVGVLIIVQSYIVLSFGTQGRPAPEVMPEGTVRMLGGIVPVDRLYLLAVVAVVTVVLWAVYRWTGFGLATRAAQENEAEAALSGLSGNRLALSNTVLACLVAGGLGIIVAPLTQLDPFTIAMAVVPALGAALVARFTSFPVACLTGLGMGVLAAIVQWGQAQSWFPQTQGVPWPGMTELLYFLVIAVILLLRGQTLPGRGAYVEPRLPAAPAAGPLLRPVLVMSAITIVALFVLPFELRQALILSLIGMVACLSLVLLTGYVGQISFVQYAVAGVAALMLSKLSSQAGLGFPWAPLVGISAAVALSLLMALPALRVRGVQLAILTLAAAQALNTFGFLNPGWGVTAAGTPVQQPSIFGFLVGTSSPIEGLDGADPSPVFGIGCLLVLIGAVVLVDRTRKSSLGKNMLAVRSNERASAGAGVSPTVVKLTAFGLSALLASVSGVLYAYNFAAVDAARFSVASTLTLIAFAYIGGITTIKGAVLGGLMITQGLFSYVLSHYLGISITYQAMFGGFLLIITVITNPNGIALAPPPKWPGKLARRLRGAPSPGPGGPQLDAGTGVAQDLREGAVQ